MKKSLRGLRARGNKIPILVLPKRLKRTVSRTFAYCKIMLENSNLTGMHSCERRLICSRQEHSERQRRSFEPQFANVQMLGDKRRSDPPDKVRNTGRGEYLLKEIQVVPPH